MSPAMPSSRSRRSASTSSPSRIRSPALSWTTRSEMLSHSGVAYSGWLPTSRYSRAPLRRNTLLLRPQETTRRNRYLATSSGESLRLPRNVHVTPYSFSSPNIRLSIANSVNHGRGQAPSATLAGSRPRASTAKAPATKSQGPQAIGGFRGVAPPGQHGQGPRDEVAGAAGHRGVPGGRSPGPARPRPPRRSRRGRRPSGGSGGSLPRASTAKAPATKSQGPQAIGGFRGVAPPGQHGQGP